MDDYFSNTRSNDELTLREAWDNFTKGLISKEQWAETLEGVKRLKQNVPAVAETWARGTIAPIFGGTGDINELGDTTRNKLIDMLPANVGKFAKNLDAAQRLFTPAALTRHLPTTKEVLKSTPRITPEHEGAETMEDVAGFVSPGTLGLANEIGGLTSKGVNRLGDYAVQKITGNPTATTTDVINYASKFAPNKITVYHGSPHEFDKFDISKTATGENGQAYGYGTYVAEHPDVAGKFKKQGGHLYKVDLPDEHIGNMLEWDKPLLNQSDKVRKSLLSLNDPYINEALTTMPKLSPNGEYWTYMGNTYASKAEALEDANPLKIMHGYTNLGKNPKELSEVLNKAGIKGVKYENYQITKGKGGNTFNYVVFDPKDLKILEKNGLNLTASPHVPGVKKGEELFVHHNLTADKLLEADRLGGMPVPSLAISKTGQPLDKFGDITLVGGKEMATPSAKNPVFRSDAYTKRRPGIDYKMDAKSEKAFDKLFDDVKDAIPDYKGYMFNLKDDMSDMQRSYLLKAKYLNEKGLMPKLSDYPGLEGYKIYGDMNDIIKKNPGDYEDWVHSFREDLPNKGVNVKERIFKGYTYSGNRRYAEANLENMVKEMKGGAGTENWDYGVGNLRAKATPKFRRFEQIREERGRINSELFNKVKDEANKNYSDLTDRLSALGQNYSPTDALHEVAVKKNIDLLDRIYPNITPELKADISVFMNKMQHMPTDYFEIKPQRAVGIGEFKGAIIPKDSSKRVRETLEKHGVKDIHEYTTDEERKSLIDKFGKHMFGVAPVGLGTSEYFERKQK